MAADDHKARLARRGLGLIDAADPDEIKARVRERASGAAQGAVLRGLEAIAHITGTDSGAGSGASQSAAGQSADVSAALRSLDDHRGESFDARLRTASAVATTRQAQRAALRADVSAARRSFPEASKQFAVLVFACVELLDDLSDYAEGRRELPAEDVERREELLTRVAGLLAPRAPEALASFVDHIVQVSRKTRTR